MTVSEQVAPQEIPVGRLVTTPNPVPVLATDSVTALVKVAVTDFAEEVATMQGAVPEQAPDQPEKVESAAAVAVNAT